MKRGGIRRCQKEEFGGEEVKEKQTKNVMVENDDASKATERRGIEEEVEEKEEK